MGTKYINTLHDVCDNANIDESDPKNDVKSCKLLSLLSKLRDMYLCRYDLQKLDIQFMKKKQLKNRKQKTPKPTPFTVSRGHLIDALSKPQNARNRNLKNIADSFDIADDDNDVMINNNDNIRYPKLNEMKHNQMTS